jgi:hypothetical protein
MIMSFILCGGTGMANDGKSPEELARLATAGGTDAKPEVDPAKVKVLKDGVQAQINEYGDSMDRNRRVAFWFKVVEGLFGGATTVLVGVSSSKILGATADTGLYLTVVALITSAVTTLSIGIDNFVGYRDNWVRYSGAIVIPEVPRWRSRRPALA